MIQLRVVETTASTNDDAKEALRAGEPTGLVILAHTQSAGRGRQGRSWVGTPGDTMMASMVIGRTMPARRVGLLSLAAGFAVHEYVATVAPSARLKWPNDVLIDGRKVAGILTESMLRGEQVVGAVIGIGLNLHARSLPPELQSTATALSAYTEVLPTAEQAAVRIFERVLQVADDVLARGLAPYVQRMNAAHALAGKTVRAEGAGLAVVREIDDDGRLVVQTDRGVERWTSGEVHLVDAY